jgi:hypothetical protein
MSGSSSAFLETLSNGLCTYFDDHDVGEDDPILLLECLPQMDLVNGAPAAGVNRAALITALTNYAIDIGGLGVAFLFPSHDVLALAKEQLGDGTFPGNVQWAFIPGLGALQITNQALQAAGLPPLPPPLPCVSTRMITFYSQDTGVLRDDRCNFFTYV